MVYNQSAIMSAPYASPFYPQYNNLQPNYISPPPMSNQPQPQYINSNPPVHYQIPSHTGGMVDISPQLSPNPADIYEKRDHPIAVNNEEMQQLLSLVGTSSYYVQAVKNFAYMVTQFYAVMVGALLVVFVPQQCCNDYSAPSYNGTTYYTSPYGVCTSDTMPTAYQCTFSDEFTNLSLINKVALGWNFITLGAMLHYFLVLWVREKYILQYLVEDPLSNEVHIRAQWYKYPELQYALNRRSRNSFIACCIGISFQLVNVILSGYIVFALYYSGSKTVIGFASNILIQGGFVFTGAEIAYVDWKHHLARTILAHQPISYNKVNPQYKN